MSLLCLGEAIVDLICPTALARGDLDDLRGARSFVPRLGGTMANVAVVAARHGAAVSLAGATADDPWGRWLRAALSEAGVGLDRFALAPGAITTVAFVLVDEAGEPTYVVHGGAQSASLPEIADRLPAAVQGCTALCVGSNTMVAEPERELTLEARRQALELGRPVIFDANVRMHRWPGRGRVATVAGACVPDCLLVKANRLEAEILTGERDPARAADSLRAAGAQNVIVTLGAEGALLRGEVNAQVPAHPAQVRNTAGAGDVLLGVVLARLVDAGFYPPAIAAALPAAVQAAARATEAWGATERPTAS
ncbi:MAG TPA: PfkB family carbohydrate kinase [Solirubrobacteraceae bacterium]|jgi:fructokinase|nr:PfkB family carbohydrate kinase [Solirubrobacteraceae bacterium]